MIKRILAPTDLSDAALGGVRMAAMLAGKLGASVVLLHVFDSGRQFLGTPTALPSAMFEQMVEKLRARAGELLEELRSEFPTGVNVSTTVLEDGASAPTITEHAAEIGADMIVMSTHGRTGLGRLLTGSVTEKTVRLAHCPVLTVPTTG